MHVYNKQQCAHSTKHSCGFTIMVSLCSRCFLRKYRKVFTIIVIPLLVLAWLTSTTVDDMINSVFRNRFAFESRERLKEMPEREERKVTRGTDVETKYESAIRGLIQIDTKDDDITNGVIVKVNKNGEEELVIATKSEDFWDRLPKKKDNVEIEKTTTRSEAVNRDVKQDEHGGVPQRVRERVKYSWRQVQDGKEDHEEKMLSTNVENDKSASNVLVTLRNTEGNLEGGPMHGVPEGQKYSDNVVLGGKNDHQGNAVLKMDDVKRGVSTVVGALEGTMEERGQRSLQEREKSFDKVVLGNKGHERNTTLENESEGVDPSVSKVVSTLGRNVQGKFEGGQDSVDEVLEIPRSSSEDGKTLRGDMAEENKLLQNPLAKAMNDRNSGSSELGKESKAEHEIGQGYLNKHVWFDICSSSLDSLREFLLFPFAPNYRGTANTLINMKVNKINYGQRLFGYLAPPASGKYQFGVKSGGGVEVWLSYDKNPKNVQMVAKATPSVGDSSMSGYHVSRISVVLKLGGMYYVEILHKHGDTADDQLEIVWRNSNDQQYLPVPTLSLVPYQDDLERAKTYLGSDLAIISHARADLESKSGAVENSVKYEVVDETVVKDVLQTCAYEPSYLIHHKLVRYQGARNKSNTRFVKIYPGDSTNESLALVKGEEWWELNAIGNILIDNKTALDVVKTFVNSLERKYPRKYELNEIVDIRSTEDQQKGIRFFLNLRIHDKSRNSTKTFMKYVFKKKNKATLCFPQNFNWNPQATVHVIVPVKNSSPWMLAFVKNIIEILSSTLEPKINVVIADYATGDMDIKRVLEESSIKNFQVVSLPRNESFLRAVALQHAANAIRDPHGILCFCDLHLKIPRKLFVLIRQHCVEGKMAFAPVVKRLRCGSYPSSPYGYWETLGFGLFAIYKSDFDRVGGMDVDTFTKWGGEDWELLDRVLMSGIEVERLKIPGFYHFYHPPMNGFNNRVNAR